MTPPRVLKYTFESDGEYARAVNRRDYLFERGVEHSSPEFFELQLLFDATSRYDESRREARIDARQAMLESGAPEATQYQEQLVAWRDAWRPEVVRTLLVAESHVREVAGDTEVEVVLPSQIPEKLPQGFCRLVYCLGYGENSLCYPDAVKNAGTQQYWDLFGQIAFGVGHLQPRKRESNDNEQIAWKISTLRRLREQGVWLVDASTSPCYASGGQRLLSGNAYSEQLLESWGSIVWPSIRGEPIEAIWIIGKGVAGALQSRTELRTAKVISQPQTRNQSLYRDEVAQMILLLHR